MKDMERVWNNIMIELQDCWLEQIKKLSKLPLPTVVINNIDYMARRGFRELDEFGLEMMNKTF